MKLTARFAKRYPYIAAGPSANAAHLAEVMRYALGATGASCERMVDSPHEFLLVVIIPDMVPPLREQRVVIPSEELVGAVAPVADRLFALKRFVVDEREARRWSACDP